MPASACQVRVSRAHVRVVGQVPFVVDIGRPPQADDAIQGMSSVGNLFLDPVADVELQFTFQPQVTGTCQQVQPSRVRLQEAVGAPKGRDEGLKSHIGFDLTPGRR